MTLAFIAQSQPCWFKTAIQELVGTLYSLINNSNNSTFHNNRLNALYIRALVIGPTTSLYCFSAPWVHTPWSTKALQWFILYTILTSTLACTHLYPWVERRIVIHKYLRQFRYSYWWRARYMGVYKPLFMTGKKC